MKVGFIGLGAMGLPMAMRVARGYEVFTTVHRRREAAEQLAAVGARVLDTPAEVARHAEIVITIVPADRELRETVLGEAGLVHGFSAGKILIEMTTATAGTVQEIEQSLATLGVEVLDAPVSGGTTGAAEGTLTIMAGGTPALLEKCRPLLETMGRNIVHVGGVGQGKVVKIVNQLMAAVHLLTIGEAFALGIGCGADPQVLYDVIKTSSGYSKMMDLRLPGFLFDGKFTPGFKLDLLRKDVNLAVTSASILGTPLLFGSVAAQLLAAASTAGRGAEDFAAAADFVAALSATKLSQNIERKTLGK